MLKQVSPMFVQVWSFNIVIDFDENFGKVTSAHQINFVPCGEGFWDCANESESCVEECE